MSIENQSKSAPAQKPAFYDFLSNRDKFAAAMRTPLMQQAYKNLIDSTSVVRKPKYDKWFKLDPDLLAKTRNKELTTYDMIMQIGKCTGYLTPIHPDDSRDWLDKLIEKAKTPNDPEWYAYPRECHAVAMHFLYPLCRIMFPKHKDDFHVHFSHHHSVVLCRPFEEYVAYAQQNPETLGTNYDRSDDFSRPLVFDLNYLCVGLSLDSVFWKGVPCECIEHLDCGSRKYNEGAKRKLTRIVRSGVKGIDVVEYFFDFLMDGDYFVPTVVWYKQMMIETGDREYKVPDWAKRYFANQRDSYNALPLDNNRKTEE
jgi:hypothetical protein